ncbi:MAG: GEVED domain-containing protein [Ferruginibacter sp.]
MQFKTTLIKMRYILKNVFSVVICFGLFLSSVQASPKKASPKVACVFSGSLGAGDGTLSSRLSRPGAPTGACGTAYATPATIAGGPFFYDTYSLSNTTGSSQCVTFTLTTNDVTNANIQFAVYNNSFSSANIVTNYLADPGLSTATPAAPAGISAQVTVPAGANLILLVYSTNPSSGATGTASDYTVTASNLDCAPPAPCAGTPDPGNTIASVANVCNGVNFALSTQNSTAGTGVTYQWQDSSSTTANAWVNIAGATSSTLSTSQSGPTYYRVVVTCTASAATGTSKKVFVDKTPQSGCYCDAGADDGSFESISNFSLGSMNNASTGITGYENFTNISTDLVQGANYPFDVENAFGFSSDQVIIFIDFNHNGSFNDPGETVYTSANGAGPYIGTLNVPAGALTGPTRLRIRLHDTSFDPNATPCGNSAYGEVEDYTVNIVPCVALTAPTQPSNATVLCGNTANFTLGGTGSFITYKWQQRVSATAPWTTVTNGGMFSGANSATLTISNATVSMNGYQYQVLYSGTCTPDKFSNAVTLTVNPFVPTISPANAAICVGSIQKLTITNLASPSVFSTTFNSPTLNTAIPQGSTVGISNVIAVSGIPAGAVITGVSVKMNVTHPQAGFSVVSVIKGPVGTNVLNLDYATSLTQSLGANFRNTVISSAGVNALGAGTAPWTGTFAPDAQMTAAAPFAPTGPDGLLATTPKFSDLWAGNVVNGNWTFGIYDFGTDPGANGSLDNWSITITYSIGLPETGIWGPVTGGNIFKDAAATIPYDSTQLNTVYVKPTVTTNYTVAVNNGGTCDGTATVPVTVSNPITDATIPVANAATCAGKNASFTAASTTGVGVKHQWYVSTDNGATFTKIPASGAPYGTTAVTGTLTITGAALTMNNYKYKDSLYVTSCASYKFSNVATLTVNANPTIVLSAAPYKKLYPGLTTTITAAVSPNPASTYTWFRNGIAVPNVTGNSIVVDVDHLGAYTVTVNDVNTCSSTSSAISITDSSNTTLFIYPSPSTGQFQVRYYNNPAANRDGGVPGFVNVFDSKGARVWSKSYSVLGGYTRMDVDLTNFSKGIYRVELTDTKGVRIKTGSVVIF